MKVDLDVHEGKRCLLIPIDPTTWSSILQEAVKAEEIKVIPYDLTLEYDYWTYRAYKAFRILFDAYNIPDDIMTSILPDDAQGEIPVGFAIVGHIGKKNNFCFKVIAKFQQHI